MDEPDLQGLERELTRLPDVSIARIVTKPAGGVAEVHIVALPGKPPKQIARDVESVAVASFGLRLDRRTISVVQLDTSDLRRSERSESPESPEPDVSSASSVGAAAGTRRLVLSAVDELSTTARTNISVTLTDGSEEVRGHSEGSIASVAHGRVVAEAVLDALRQVAPTAAAVAVDTAHVVPVGRAHVAIVTLAQVDPPAEHQLAGTAVVRDGRNADALARAVLDATNRRLHVPA